MPIMLFGLHRIHNFSWQDHPWLRKWPVSWWPSLFLPLHFPMKFQFWSLNLVPHFSKWPPHLQSRIFSWPSACKSLSWCYCFPGKFSSGAGKSPSSSDCPKSLAHWSHLCLRTAGYYKTMAGIQQNASCRATREGTGSLSVPAIAQRRLCSKSGPAGPGWERCTWSSLRRDQG